MVMDVLFFTHLLNGLLMIAMPIGLAIYLTSRWNLGGRIWWIGAATFLLSQVAHIPFNWGIGKLLNQTGMVAWDPKFQLIFNAVFLGLSAGIFEEGARYLVLRWWAKDARSWRKGVFLAPVTVARKPLSSVSLSYIVFFSLQPSETLTLPKSFPQTNWILLKDRWRHIGLRVGTLHFLGQLKGSLQFHAKSPWRSW